MTSDHQMIAISDTKALYFGGDGISDRSSFIYNDNDQTFQTTGPTVANTIAPSNAAKVSL